MTEQLFVENRIIMEVETSKKTKIVLTVIGSRRGRGVWGLDFQETFRSNLFTSVRASRVVNKKHCKTIELQE